MKHTSCVRLAAVSTLCACMGVLAHAAPDTTFHFANVPDIIDPNGVNMNPAFFGRDPKDNRVAYRMVRSQVFLKPGNALEIDVNVAHSYDEGMYHLPSVLSNLSIVDSVEYCSVFVLDMNGKVMYGRTPALVGTFNGQTKKSPHVVLNLPSGFYNVQCSVYSMAATYNNGRATASDTAAFAGVSSVGISQYVVN